ncbi:MAG: hypothetical protein LWX52_09560 [Deltaproteobacteria bacterium]|jgi:hypothetical protein|nr:hypothetical protein [Deltaproteobacteria bacterium]
MAKQLDNKEIVTSEELMMAQMIQLDAISQLLIEKGILTEQEFHAKLKQVRYQYQQARAET